MYVSLKSNYKTTSKLLKHTVFTTYDSFIWLTHKTKLSSLKREWTEPETAA